MTEIGVVMEPSARYTARLAARIEEMGFESLVSPDTQNLYGDPYQQLALAAANTKTLKLGPGVTHPVTRVAAVTASALATLQIESGGRAICGMGRGDSAAAHIGKRQATTEELRRYAEDVRSYLAGGDVMIGEHRSTMRWINPGDMPTVPIDIACTGPKTIRMAADTADRISFAVGSAPERLDWALETCRARLEETGRDRSEISIGAYINLVCHEDKKQAINIARVVAGLIAHFTGMKAAPVDHLPPQLKPLAVKLKTQYDMKHHAQEGGSHLELVDDEFVDWFAICGLPQECIDRLSGLVEKGLDHIHLLGGSAVAEPHGARIEGSVNQMELFATEVMPAIRAL